MLFGLCGIGLSGCRTAQTSSTKDAVVSSTTARKAFAIIEKTREYLPYEYLSDGCYARATYMQMELMVENIPSRVVYVRGAFDTVTQDWRDGGALLQPAQWVFHVAPIIKVDGIEIVLDPGISRKKKGGAIILEDWLGLMNAKHVVEAPARAISGEVNERDQDFVVSRAPNPDVGPVLHQNVHGEIIRSIAEMPAFSRKLILENFRDLDGFLVQASAENLIPTGELAGRRKTLLSRTIKLTETLKTRGKIDGPIGDLVTEENLRKIQQENASP